jgi:hypothetical protein
MELRQVLQSPRRSFLAQLTWAINNALFVFGIIPIVLLLGDWFDLSRTVESVAVMAVALARTSRDYYKAWGFYFPPPGAKTVASPLGIGQDAG